VTGRGARADWEARIGRRSAAGVAAERRLPPPGRLEAESGAGQVTLRWEPVEGAIGYLLHRGPSADGPWEPIDHGGMDVLSHPGPVYADTTGKPRLDYFYAVASVAAEEDGPGELSAPVQARALGEIAAPLELRVDAAGNAGRLQRVWRMIGSERLSQLLEETASPTGGSIGEEFEEALRLARAELGADRVRAHAILHDDLAVFRGDGAYDFAVVDEVYDRVLGLGLRPIVELSFMPRGLAEDPSATVFEYGAGISVPRDWDEWGSLVGALAAHLVERYGAEEVARWGFEVWNEANLEVFWTGSQPDYFRLYETAARAVKAVEERLPVGGPATAAAGWIPDFLDFVVEAGAPLDFLTTHTYGNLPLDVGEALRVRGLGDVEVWWTEWGVIPTHFATVNDTVLSATFTLHGMKSAQGRAEALAYWVVSDHFEELGRAPALLHGGFGLLSVGNLRKPRWWALSLAESLGDELLPIGLARRWRRLARRRLGRPRRGRPRRRAGLERHAGSDQGRRAAAARPRAARARRRPAGRPPSRDPRPRGRRALQRRGALGGREAVADGRAARGLRAADVLHEESLGDVASGDELELRLPMPGIARLRYQAV
jgi:xylan 1,4-beta-xylosidase